MGYTTEPDLITAAGGRARFVQISDRDGDGIADAEFVAAAQAKADGLIDSYAGKRYAVPIANPSQMLVQVAAEEAVYQMILRGDTGPSESERDEWENRKGWLESLAKGKVVPSDPPPTKSSTIKNRFRRSNRAMSRERSKGFW